MAIRKVLEPTKPARLRAELGVEINPENIGEGITQSEMQCWDNCPEKWYLGYNMMLHAVGKFAWHFVFGSWMHGALEEFYASRGKRWSIECAIPNRKFVSHEHLAKEDYWAAVADTQMQIYASNYKHDFDIWKPIVTEEIIDLEFRGVRLKGMIDMFAQFLPEKKRPTFYVWDHKTTFALNKAVIMGWDFRFQFMFYVWLMSKMEKYKDMYCGGFAYNAIKKPQLKWNEEKESLASFQQRMQVDMQERPEMYFFRDKLSLTKDALQRFEFEILGPKLDRIRLLMDPKVPIEIKRAFVRTKNTDYCISKFGTACEFLQLCQNGMAAEKFRYKVRPVKHQELIAETED